MRRRSQPIPTPHEGELSTTDVDGDTTHKRPTEEIIEETSIDHDEKTQTEIRSEDLLSLSDLKELIFTYIPEHQINGRDEIVLQKILDCYENNEELIVNAITKREEYFGDKHISYVAKVLLKGYTNDIYMNIKGSKNDSSHESVDRRFRAADIGSLNKESSKEDAISDLVENIEPATIFDAEDAIYVDIIDSREEDLRMEEEKYEKYIEYLENPQSDYYAEQENCD